MINNPKILIIDDIRDNILIAKALLKKNFKDAIILTASTGSSGLELAKSTVPDLILLDILMPDNDGFYVCTEIKENIALAGIPIIFVTALKEDKSVKLKALRAGAEGFISKPIDEITLVANVHAMLKLREAQKYKENEQENLKRLVKQKTLSLEIELSNKTNIERKLRDSEQLYIDLIDSLGSGIIIHGLDCSVLSCNKKATKILGKSEEQMTGKLAHEFIALFLDSNGLTLTPDEHPINLVVKSSKAIRNYVLGIRKTEESSISWITVNAFPRFNEDGTIREVVASFIEITEAYNSEKQLVYAANNDYLTGLFNRRYFEKKLSIHNDLESYPITVAVADINGLKLVNDAFGHNYGDEMLCKAADVIKDSFSESDIIARIGGDEFGILMPNTTQQQALEKVRLVHLKSKDTKVQSIELSIAVGQFTKTVKDLDLFEVTRTAEDYMYRQKLIEIPSMRSNAIETILSTLYEKDKYSEFHSRQVSKISEQLAIAHKLDDQLIKDIKTAGLLHDIGKIIIPSDILTKVGKLTVKEREVINTHSEIGFRILNSSAHLREISKIVLNHHECWDGTGYPRNIMKNDIPIEARIISIADAFDAMTSERLYRKTLSFEQAKSEIVNSKGLQFDPDLVDTFVLNFDTIIDKVFNQN